jgi:RNase P protein component
VHLDVRVLASPLDCPRVGIVVPRHQHTAVDRNQLKRRLRELVRVELLPSLRALPAAPPHASLDISIRARRDAYAATMDALRLDVLTIEKRVTADRVGA